MRVLTQSASSEPTHNLSLAVASRLPVHTEKTYETLLKDAKDRIAMYTEAGVLLGKVDTEICKRALRATARRTDKPSDDPLRDILRPHMALMYIIEATTYMHEYRRAPLDMQHTIEFLRWDGDVVSRVYSALACGCNDSWYRTADHSSLGQRTALVTGQTGPATCVLLAMRRA